MPKPARRPLLAALTCAALSGALVGCDDWGCSSRPSGEASTSSPGSAGSAGQQGSPAEPAPPPVDTSSRAVQAPSGAPPTIASVLPPSCGVAGGERIVIRGANFSRPQVLFGAASAQVVETSPDELTVIAPAQERAATVSIVVTNRGGGYAVAGNAFTYVP